MAAPRAERSPLGQVLDTRRVHLGYDKLDTFAADAGVSLHTLFSLLTGHRRVFRRDVMTRLDRAWRLPPGTLEQALTGKMPPEAVAEIPAAPTGPDFIAHLHVELAARGARLPTPAQLDQAAGAWQATAKMLADVGSSNPEVTEALADTVGTVRALADLLRSAGGLTDRQRDGLALVDELAARHPHMTEEDLRKFRAGVMRGKTPAAAVMADAVPIRPQTAATST